MVATVLRLRYRILGNTLRRSVGQMVGFVFGMLGALWILFLVLAGVIALAVFQDLEVARTVAILGGSLLLLGWVFGPVIVAGMETTVDAERLAPFPLTTAQVMQALTAAGLTGIPGIATALAALFTVGLWFRAPLAAVVAVPCIVVAVVTCVVASRYVGTLATGLGNGRARQAIATIFLLLLMLSGPIMAGTAMLLSTAVDLEVRVAQVAEVLGWTPIGAVWAVPGDLAAGAWLPGLAKLGIALATLAALWLLWARALAAATSSPAQRSSSRVTRGLGLFGRMPTGGVGATWARALTGWVRDPRYSRSLIMLPVLPIVFAFAGGIEGPMFRASAILVAFVLCFSLYADISFDGTAFASVLSSGVRGWADRLGRILGAAVLAVPLTIVLAVVCALIAGSPEDLPAVLGGALGVLLAGYGVTAVSSALLVVPAPAPGDNPFKSAPGQTFLSGILVMVIWAACGLIGAPAIGLAIAAMVTGSMLLGWIALAVGLVVGIGVLVAGVIVGGRTLDRTGPDLLARIKAFPTT